MGKERGRPSKTRIRTALNKAEEEFVKNHVKDNIDVLYEAIPDVDKGTIKGFVNSLIKNTGLIKNMTEKVKGSGPVSKLMGKNQAFGAVVNTQAASELADERRKQTVKSSKEIAEMKSDEIFLMRK